MGQDCETYKNNFIKIMHDYNHAFYDKKRGFDL
jgi:hypothetical protein